MAENQPAYGSLSTTLYHTLFSWTIAIVTVSKKTPTLSYRMASLTHARDSSTVTPNSTRCKYSLDYPVSLDVIDYYIELYRYSLYENETLTRVFPFTLLKVGSPVQKGACSGAALRELC
jgi:hypothetical protein